MTTRRAKDRIILGREAAAFIDVLAEVAAAQAVRLRERIRALLPSHRNKGMRT
jgi:hypothetical protein